MQGPVTETTKVCLLLGIGSGLSCVMLGMQW